MNLIEWKWLNKLYKNEYYTLSIVHMINDYGKDILQSEKYLQEKNFIQHGKVTVFQHSYTVAYLSVCIALLLHIDVDFTSMIRGALLHDYFLYDWHKANGHKFHGFTHASTSLYNASYDFSLNEKERDIIQKHMFPLNITPPKYKESYIVCLADKISATFETFCLR